MYSTNVKRVTADAQSTDQRNGRSGCGSRVGRYYEDRKKKCQEDVGLIEAAGGEGSKGEGEPRVFIRQQLGSASVEGGSSGGETETSASLVDGDVFRELANHEKEEGEVEEEEQNNQGDVDPEGCQEEDECDDEPGCQEDSNSAWELRRVSTVGRGNAEAGVKEGGVGQPKATVTGESSRAERVPSYELPHASHELSKTTNEAGHTDDGICDSDAAGLDVVHGQDEGRGGEGEETKRTRVADFPQRGRALDVGVGGERAMSTAGTVVNAVRIGEGALVVVHDSHG